MIDRSRSAIDHHPRLASPLPPRPLLPLSPTHPPCYSRCSPPSPFFIPRYSLQATTPQTRCFVDMAELPFGYTHRRKGEKKLWLLDGREAIDADGECCSARMPRWKGPAMATPPIPDRDAPFYMTGKPSPISPSHQAHSLYELAHADRPSSAGALPARTPHLPMPPSDAAGPLGPNSPLGPAYVAGEGFDSSWPPQPEQLAPLAFSRRRIRLSATRQCSARSATPPR